MKSLKIIAGLACLLMLASNVWSMSHWTESRGVYDDVCYLRQAHLFQRFGLTGFDTDLSRDDDHYLVSKLKEIGFPTWNDVTTLPCHTAMSASNKRVAQYPPGTGLLLAMFPEGHQVVPLYVSASIVITGFALLGIVYASSTATVLAAGAFGCLAIYLMINPSKASYSMAPTMVVCALAGYLTARLFIRTRPSRRTLLSISLGLLLGLSVNLRLPNLFLASGYLVVFVMAFWSSRKIVAALRGVAFAVAFLIGLAPTLLANAINAGSPLSTTYGGQDVAPPDFSFRVVWQYAGDIQTIFLLLALGCAAFTLRARCEEGIRRVALVTVANLVINIVFFMSHPVFTPYYTIPIAMLSLWSLLFASLMQQADEVRAGRPAKQAVAV
ncbi:hypothetical protein [Bradyrhizobium sp.]|uniref:hypothetical protein n=1 Tax=Bradyrhizobium sp. TaxID=376 RepID=UPI003C4B218D